MNQSIITSITILLAIMMTACQGYQSYVDAQQCIAGVLALPVG